MLDRIIVAYDGSDLAKAALAHALQLADRSSLRVLAVHVIEPALAAPPIGDPLLAFDPTLATVGSPEEKAAAIAERRETGERLLEDVERVAGKSGADVERRMVEGELIPTLCDLADQRSLLVIGRRGRFRPAGLGSATRALVCKAPCPVMVVSGAYGPLGRVLGVYENTGAGRRAVVLARDLSIATKWPLTVLAVPGHGMDATQATDAARQESSNADIVTLVEGQNEAKFLEHAAADAGDLLLVLGAYSESWLHELFFGDAAPRVLKRIGAPVVLAH